MMDERSSALDASMSAHVTFSIEMVAGWGEGAGAVAALTAAGPIAMRSAKASDDKRATISSPYLEAAGRVCLDGSRPEPVVVSTSREIGRLRVNRRARKPASTRKG